MASAHGSDHLHPPFLLIPWETGCKTGSTPDRRAEQGGMPWGRPAAFPGLSSRPGHRPVLPATWLKPTRHRAMLWEEDQGGESISQSAGGTRAECDSVTHTGGGRQGMMGTRRPADFTRVRSLHGNLALTYRQPTGLQCPCLTCSEGADLWHLPRGRMGLSQWRKLQCHRFCKCPVKVWCSHQVPALGPPGGVSSSQWCIIHSESRRTRCQN